MSRWSEAYRSRTRPPDTIDTIDNPTPPPAGSEGYVSSVNSVTAPGYGGGGTAKAFPGNAEAQARGFVHCVSSVAPPVAGDGRPPASPDDPCPACRHSVWWQPRLGDPWRCDFCDPHPDGWPDRARVHDLAEQHAIDGQPALSAIGSEARDLANAKHAALVAGLVVAASKRPPSWWNNEPHDPTPGATCSCCGGRSWWSRDDRHGWCCAVCHPHQGCECIEATT